MGLFWIWVIRIVNIGGQVYCDVKPAYEASIINHTDLGTALVIKIRDYLK